MLLGLLIYKNGRQHIAEDCSVDTHCYGNLKSNEIMSLEAKLFSHPNELTRE
jgi:hypothetical protein